MIFDLGGSVAESKSGVRTCNGLAVRCSRYSIGPDYQSLVLDKV
jgi:hypothetical protein